MTPNEVTNRRTIEMQQIKYHCLEKYIVNMVLQDSCRNADSNSGDCATQGTLADIEFG